MVTDNADRAPLTTARARFASSTWRRCRGARWPELRQAAATRRLSLDEITHVLSQIGSALVAYYGKGSA
jgi:hypothetical protein